MQALYFIKPKHNTKTKISRYPAPVKNIQQITITGNPDYYGFGNGISLNDFFPDYSIYIAKRGPSHYLDGGHWYGHLYNHVTGLWSTVFTIKDTSPLFLSGVSCGIVGNQIFIHGSRYTVSGMTDTFYDTGYITSVDLTTLSSVEDLTLSSSWNSFVTLPSATYPRYESYGGIYQSSLSSNTYFGMWFEHTGGVTWRVNALKIICNGVDDFTITNINLQDGSNRYGEPKPVNCSEGKWLVFARQNGSTSGTRKIGLFSTTDDFQTHSYIGVTNLGSGSGHCIVDAIYVNGLIHVIYQDRGTGYIMISRDNTYAQCLTLTLNTPEQYHLNNASDSLNGLGYPSTWVVRNENIVFLSFIKESSSTEAHVYGTLDLIT